MHQFLYSILGIVNAMSPYILLGFFIAGLLHAFVPNTTMARHLSGRGIKPVIKAALFGIPLPLCSCGVLPTAVGLRRQGASKGATTSFLIATPQTGVDSIAATYSLLGLPFAILRPLAALIGAVAGGYVVDRADSDDADSVIDVEPQNEGKTGFFHKLGQAVTYGFVDMVASVGRWLVIGLIVAALITVLVPEDLFVSLSNYPLLAMLAVVVVAIPMYVCATGSIPIAMSLMMKGLSPGIAFVLLMAGPAANFASLIILGKTQGKRATAMYVASVTVTAIAFGLAIDYLMPREWFMINGMSAAHAHGGVQIFPAICSAILLCLLVIAPVLMHKLGHKHNHHIDMGNENTADTARTVVIKVEGMACPHCKKRVEETAMSVDGVVDAKVDLAKGTLTVTGTSDTDALFKAISLAGYTPSLA